MSMNKVKNLYRYWVDKDSKTIVRQWTDDEYKNIDPHTHIFEKYWSHYRICGFIHIPVPRYHELVCFEFREEFNEELGLWIHTYEKF